LPWHEPLLTAGQAARARRSRTAFGALSAAAAAAVASGPNGILADAARSFYQPLTLRPGERLLRYLDSKTALVRQAVTPHGHRTGSGRLLTAASTVPMFLGSGRHRRPVDLHLRRVAGGFSPITALVPFTASTAGVSFPSLGVDVGLQGARGVVQDRGEETFQPSAFADTDVAVSPLTVGAELWLQLRAISSPETFRFQIGMPAGASLRPEVGGSAAVMRDGKLVMSISPPAATDARGNPVRASYAVDGSTLVLSVFHRQDSTVTYPVSVDPVFGGNSTCFPDNGEQDPYNYVDSTSCPPGAGIYEQTGNPELFSQWTLATGSTLAYQRDPSWAGNGLWMYAAPGVNYPAGAYSEFVYRAPAGAFIQRVDFAGTEHAVQAANSSQYFEGIYDVAANAWDQVSVTDSYTGVTSYIGANPYLVAQTRNGGTQELMVGGQTIPYQQGSFQPGNGNEAVFGLQLNTGGVETASAYDWAYMYGATVWMYDPSVPSVTAGVPASNTAWTDDGAKTYTINPVATDNGFGIGAFNIFVTSSTGIPVNPQSTFVNCVADHTNPCPGSTNTTSSPTNGQVGVTYTLPEGSDQVGLTAYTPTGHADAGHFWTQRIDRNPPTLSLNGSLYAAAVGNPGGSSEQSPLPGSSYPLQITASDTASGVAEVDVSVDGGNPTVLQGNCISGSGATSGCDQSTEFNYTFQSDDYPSTQATEHTITVTAKDCLGADLPGSTTTSVCGGTPLASHDSAPQSFQVWTQPSASLANPPTPAQNDTLGLERYYDYRTVQTGAGSSANVNLATGNLVWNDVPVLDPGQGLSSFVEVTYNSQQRLSDLNLLNQGGTSQILSTGYDQIGQGFSLGIDGLTRLNEQLDLSQQANGEVSFTDVDGTHHTFVYSNGQWVAPPGGFLHLRAWNPAPYTPSTWDKAWAITRPDGVTFFFDGLGYESSIEDRTGNTITFQRSYIAAGVLTGAVGQEVCAGNSVTGLLTTLLGTGCTEQVTAVTDQNDQTTQNGTVVVNTRALAIGYNVAGVNGAGLVSTITDHAGHVLQFGYDPSGDLVSMTESSSPGGGGREFKFGYAGANDATPPLTLNGPNGQPLIPALTGLLGLLEQATNISSIFEPGLTSITDPNNNKTSIQYCAADAVGANGSALPCTQGILTGESTPCPEPDSSTYSSGLAGLLNLEPKCVSAITARDGGATNFTYNDQLQTPANPGCASGELECTLVTGPQADQDGGREKWTDSIDSAFRRFQQVDPLGRETLTSWNNATTGSSGSICSPAQSLTGCESGPANTTASTTIGMIASGYATDPSATTTPSPTVTEYTYDPNGETTEQQGPADVAAGESRSFRDTITTYHESAGPTSLQSPSGTDAGGQFVADETEQVSNAGTGTEDVHYALDSSNDGLIRVITDPDENKWSFNYYPGTGGLLQSETDPMGNKIYYGNALGQFAASSTLGQNDGYDPSGLPELVYAPSQTTPTTSQYDADGNLLARTDPRDANPAWLGGQDPTAATATATFTTYHAYDSLNEQTDAWIPKDSANGAFIHQSTAYDLNGNVTGQTDGNRQPTRFAYTPMDAVASKSSPAVQDAGEPTPAPELTSYCYDLNGDRTYEVLPDGQPWSCTSTIPPAGHATESIYDADGEPLVQEQFSTTPGTQDQLTSDAYDARGNEVGAADATDNAGLTAASAEANAASALRGTAGAWRTRTVYDSANDPTEVDTNPSASNGAIYRALSQYDAAGNLVATESAKEADSTSPNANQLIDVLTGEYNFAGETGMTTYTYDARNLLMSQTDPANDLTEYARQADGKICAVIAPDGTALSTPTTDDCTTAGSYKTTYTYSPQGWLNQIGLPTAPTEYSYAAPLQVSYGRDLVGNPKSITDPNGVKITNTFYDTGDLESTSAPWWWTYDPQGTGAPGPDPNTGATGQVSSDTPDSGLQIREKSLPEIYQQAAKNSTPPPLPSDGTAETFGNVPAQQPPEVLPDAGQTSLTYDNDMRLTSVTDAQGQGLQGTSTLTYDPVGRLSKLDQPFDGTTFSSTRYSYDQDGNVASTTTPGVATLTGAGPASTASQVAQTTTSTYDGLDRLSSSTAPGAGSKAPIAAAPAQVTTYCYYLAPVQGTAPVGTGASTCPQPLTAGTPATVTAPGGVSYQVGERVQVIDPGHNASDVDYDALGNELSSTDPLANTTSYAYDELGDQIAAVRPGGQKGVAAPLPGFTTTSSYNVAGQLTNSADGDNNPTSYTYDGDGNVLTESKPTAERAPDAAQQPQTSSYTYNGRGLRWSVTTGSGHDVRTTVTETDGDGNPVRTVDPAGVGATGNPYFAYAATYNRTPSTSQTDPDEQNPNANLDATIRVYDASNMLQAVYLPWGCNQTANTTKASCVPQAPQSEQTFSSSRNDDTRRFAETFTPSSDGMDRIGSVTQAYDWTNTDLPPSTSSPQYHTTYSYFPSGWIQQQTGPLHDDNSQQSTMYAYDAAGDQITADTTGLDGSGGSLERNFTRSYWPDGQPQQVDGKADRAIEHSYNYYYEPTGQLSQLDAAPTNDGSGTTGETDTMCYDPAGRLTRVNETFSPGAPFTGLDTAQSYDTDGNLITRSTNGYLGTGSGTNTSCPTTTAPPLYTGGQQTTFGYNNLDQETGMTVSSNPADSPQQPIRTYATTYWPSGQKDTQTRQQQPGGTAINEQWFYNDNGQESEDTNSSETKDQSYSYDTDGNLSSDENGSHLYNALDQESLWTRGGTNTPFPESTVNYVHDGTGALLEQIANTTQLNATIPGVGTGTVASNTTTRYCSTRTATSAAGLTAAQAAAQPLCAQNAGRVDNTTAINTTTITVPGITTPASSTPSTVDSCYSAFGDLIKTATNPDTCATPSPGVTTTSTYAYNAFGQLEGSIAPDPATANASQTVTDNYQYDALGRRFEKVESLSAGLHTGATSSTTSYGYVGLTDSLTRDTNTNTNGTQYTNTYDNDSNGNRLGLYTTSANASGNYYSYATNADGSIEGLESPTATPNGTQVGTDDAYHYQPYGNLELGANQGASLITPPSIAATLNPEAQANDFLFEGFQYDPGTNNYALPAREYAPGSGTYLTPDQFESASADQTLQTNQATQDPYAYVAGNPTSNIEVDGHLYIADGDRPVGSNIGDSGNPSNTSHPKQICTFDGCSAIGGSTHVSFQTARQYAAELSVGNAIDNDVNDWLNGRPPIAGNQSVSSAVLEAAEPVAKQQLEQEIAAVGTGPNGEYYQTLLLKRGGDLLQQTIHSENGSPGSLLTGVGEAVLGAIAVASLETTGPADLLVDSSTPVISDTSGAATEDAANEGIYVVNSARGTYVGQSGNIAQRFSQHLIENGGRFTQDELDAAERFGVSGGKTAREIAEQQKIDEFPNGIDDLLNQRNPIGPRRFNLMPEGYSRP